MDKPIYVKITNTHKNLVGTWYDNIYKLHPIFEVEHSQTAGYWKLKGHEVLIDKEYCEVVPTLQPEIASEEAKEILATAYINATHPVVPIEIWTRVKNGFRAGYDSGFKAANSEGGVVPEGQHLISTQQLKELHTNIGTIYDTQAKGNLERWFPTVFVPAKTYKPGQRFICSEHNEPYMIATPKEFAACLISLTDGNRYCNPVKIADPESITQEEFGRLTNGKSERFTLLPDTTDQMV